MYLGPRQVGKTTMLKLFIHDLIKRGTNPENIFYFSCEPLSDKKEIIELLNDFDEFSRETAGKKYILLDEITMVRGWEYAVKYFLETEMGRNKQIVVTGSNAFLLKTGSERLPGRNIETNLFLPLSFRDFLINFGSRGLKKTLLSTCVKYQDINNKKMHSAAMKILPFLKELNSKLMLYLKTGGYPKPIYEFLENGRISEETYEIYVKWILGDLSRLDRRENIFRSMMHGVIKNYTSKFSLLSFAREMEIQSHITVSDYLELLQSLLLINNLYQVNLGKGLPVFRKEKKAYFLSPFLYSVFSGYVTGKYQDYSSGREDKLLEGVVCEALARLNRKQLDFNHFLWFFFKKKETDFVIKVNNSPVGIELKWQRSAGKRDFSNYHVFRNRILLTRNTLKLEDGLLMMPVSLFLALLEES